MNFFFREFKILGNLDVIQLNCLYFLNVLICLDRVIKKIIVNIFWLLL